MRQNGFIFVLMPFDNSFDDIYNYGVKQTANKNGFYCERVDEQFFEGSILSRIYNQIQKADIIIADLSTKNPNVFYETGYAHALNKNVILLTQNSEDIPFDLKHYPHIIYERNIRKLSENLALKLNWYKENELERSDKSGFLEFYNKGLRIENDSTVTFDQIQPTKPFIIDDEELDEYDKINFTLNVFNTGNKLVDNISNIGLVIENVFQESRFSEEDFGDIVQLPENKILMTFGGGDFIFPQSWRTYNLHVGYNNQIKKAIDEAELQIFKEDGVLKIPLKVNINIVKSD
ncbi:hypothetical protein [Sunxiuqinia elliptica]|uniref:Uncharacterized protein n=1 Tax=Sunxiuqinia elliptica TaxID=655355 RepID=A0A4R6GWF5_9BACT|nr:hypothetical protein [Sunxiuqinia elliptica]TDN99852.1 hypothetical protein DET52_10661 [Sunxiuqinia elliptica]TDO57044.1 hypothetical protein DET65_3626 [Sunxiuqinia elliptica]